MVKAKLWCFITMVCAVAFFSEGAKIIMLTVFEPNSHRTVFLQLAKGLASKGHAVTIVGMYKPKPGDVYDGITEITVPGIDDEYEKLSALFFKLTQQGQRAYFNALMDFNRFVADSFLDSDIANKLHQQPNAYDVAIVSGLVNDYCYPLASRLAPIVTLLLPCYLLPWTADFMQVPSPPSYVPISTAPYTTNMTFTQRLVSGFSRISSKVVFDIFINPALDDKIQQRFPGLPTIKDVERSISLVLVNSEPGLTLVHPTMPNVVNIGCMHCRPAKPLSGDLAKYLETVGEEGFIFFSLGSVLKSSVLPSEIISNFINVFKNLKQKVIWKYEKDLVGLPDNVKILKWLPQQDILGHHKIRLFITHSGLLSLQEAVYHGVPVIGLPVFADQPGNIVRVIERGMGESLDIHTVTENQLTSTIYKVINDESYKLQARKCSAISRDEMEHPVDRGVFWIEYVLRHNGAPHLRSSADQLNFFQYFLLDVIFAFVMAITITTFIFLKVIRLICHKIRGGKNKKKD